MNLFRFIQINSLIVFSHRQKVPFLHTRTHARTHTYTERESLTQIMHGHTQSLNQIMYGPMLNYIDKQIYTQSLTQIMYGPMLNY